MARVQFEMGGCRAPRIRPEVFISPVGCRERGSIVREAPSTDTYRRESPGGDVEAADRAKNVFGTVGSATDFFVADEYRQYQRETIEEIERAYEQGYRHVVVEAPTGSGKSHIARALAFQSGDAHILTIQKMLQDQYQNDFTDMFVMKGRSSYPCGMSDGTLTCDNGPCQTKKSVRCSSCPYKIAKFHALQARVTVHNFDSFYYQNVFGVGFPGRKLLVVDECFVGSTLVRGEFGDVPIKSVNPGDLVWSYNERSKCIELNRVVRRIERTASRLCAITLSTGERVVCTGNHRFLTSSGWLQAKDIKPGIDLMRPIRYSRGYGKTRSETESKSCLSLLRGGVHALRNAFCLYRQVENMVLPASGCDLLFSGVFAGGEVEGSYGSRGPRSRKAVIIGADDTAKPYAKQRDALESFGFPSEYGSPSSISRWKRYRCFRAAGHLVGLLRLAYRGCCSYLCKAAGRVWVSQSLQGGYCKSETQDSHRDRRIVSQVFGETGTGQPENESLGSVGVDRVEIYERGRDDGFERLSEGGAVFDLEVERAHTYVASGVVVHNCHNIANKFSSFLSFTINSRGGIEVPEGRSLRDYDSFVRSSYVEYSKELQSLEAQYEDDALTADGLRRMRELNPTVHRMKLYLFEREKDNPTEYVFDYRETGRFAPTVTFRPVYVGDYTAEKLFEYGERTLLMSATVLDKGMFCKDVGLNPHEVYYIEVPSTFPAENRPIYKKYVGKMSYKDIDRTLPHVVDAVEEIAAKFPKRKGIVQTHSEKIASYLKDYLSDPRFTFNKDFNSPQEMLETHREKEGSIIVASGLREGLDLRGDLSKVQVFCKVPYPSLGDKVVKRRMELDPEWYGWVTAMMFVQSLGRSVRSSNERAVTYILDSGFGWFYKRYRRFIPEYIREAIVK